MVLSKRQQLDQRFGALKKIRARRWESTWQDIADNMAPYRYVADASAQSERDNGERKDLEIVNSRPIEALGTQAAGMMAGVTNPTKPWFNLTVSDKVLEKQPNVRQYLDAVKQIIGDVLHGTNWYDVLSNDTYPDLGSIGTSAMLVEEDAHRHVHFTSMRAGEYWLDQNNKREVDVCFRRLVWSVREIVQEFGLDACSPKVVQAWKKGEFNTTFVVMHAIFPNEERVEGTAGWTGMRWASCWWEESSPQRDKFLRESGYDSFPVLAPRWSTSGSDVYGRGPGWKVLGDCKMLQHKERVGEDMGDKIADPPMLRQGATTPVSLLKGGVTDVPMGANVDVRPILTVAPGALEHQDNSIVRIEERIDRGMFVHLWQAVSNDDRNQRATAAEIVAKQQEVMLMLGPLLQSLNTGLLEPCIRRVFAILNRNGILPIAPEELDGTSVTVEFISIMHQAQKATAAAGLRGLVQEVLTLAQVNPDALDKLNVDIVIEKFADMYGVDRDVVFSDDEVAKLRQKRAADKQMAEQGHAMLAATQGAANLSKVEPTKLAEIRDQFSPVAGAASGAA